MKRIVKIICILCLLLPLEKQEVWAQNLVPNPSFELHDTCPTTLVLLSYSNYWYNPTSSSPDYFNACGIDGIDTLCDVPLNIAGFQYARTGAAYAGISAYSTNPNAREYIEAELVDSMKKDTVYYVCFYVSLCNIAVNAVDNLGAYFSKTLVDSQSTNKNLNLIPQVRSLAGITLRDTAEWMLISGSFTAEGGEKFITIGNFAPDSLLFIDTLSQPGKLAYYYIDDVSVMSDTSTGMVVKSKRLELEDIKVFPNPSSRSLRIVSEQIFIEKIELINVLGAVVLQKNNFLNSEIDVSNLPSGIYFLKIQSKEGSAMRKIVKE